MTRNVWTFLSDAALLRALGIANLGVVVSSAAPPFDDEGTLFRECGFRSHLLAVGIEEPCEAAEEFDRCVKAHAQDLDLRVIHIDEEADFSLRDSFEEMITLKFPITDDKLDRLQSHWATLLLSDRVDLSAALSGERGRDDELRVSDDAYGSDEYVVGGWVANLHVGAAGIVREIRVAHAGSKRERLAARADACAEPFQCAHLLRVELVWGDADSAERFEAWVAADGARWRPVDGFPLDGVLTLLGRLHFRYYSRPPAGMTQSASCACRTTRVSRYVHSLKPQSRGFRTSRILHGAIDVSSAPTNGDGALALLDNPVRFRE
ncbi:hypothetical protein CYMTET_7213 [Cymbomonas tetramitiformis]|uniref:Uncharacterized protein n=1 Tax=Cymbomonas tetramitiformis TaxID=36881 RepID=A0AAE0GXD8_9CHLO|nr:hypothetical protein CYMTET_7213 [Cymbomonas tetramitiformis]